MASQRSTTPNRGPPPNRGPSPNRRPTPQPWPSAATQPGPNSANPYYGGIFLISFLPDKEKYPPSKSYDMKKNDIVAFEKFHHAIWVQKDASGWGTCCEVTYNDKNGWHYHNDEMPYMKSRVEHDSAIIGFKFGKLTDSVGYYALKENILDTVKNSMSGGEGLYKTSSRVGCEKWILEALTLMENNHVTVKMTYDTLNLNPGKFMRVAEKLGSKVLAFDKRSLADKRMTRIEKDFTVSGYEALAEAGTIPDYLKVIEKGIDEIMNPKKPKKTKPEIIILEE